MTHRFKPLIVAIATLLSVGTWARADLNSDIQTILKDKTLNKAEVGVEIIRLGDAPQSNQILFRHNSDIPLIPASNLKLVTTSDALDALGADFKFRTLLLKHNNDLVLIGDGDPTLGDAELLRKSGWTSITLFKNWAEQLNKNGVGNFARVVVDDSIFDEQFLHPHWPSDQIHKRYVAEVAGLNLNANCIDFYIHVTTPGEPVNYVAEPATTFANIANSCVTGGDNAIWLSRIPGGNNIVLKGHTPYSTDVPVSVTVHDPSLFTATVLAETFNAAGVKIAAAKPARDRTLRASLLKTGLDGDPSWQLLAVNETPIATVLARANKDSMNLYAEALCKRIGAAVTNEPGSWKNGTQANAAYLKKIGVAETEFKFDDGCGLSKENAISANALCQILAYNWHNKDTKDAFFTSLSISGKDGTLEHRFANSDLRGRVFGKSGFVNNVRTLSGYLKAKDDNWYAFSILINNVVDTVTPKNLQELIVKAVDTHSRELASTVEPQPQ
ncbi:MAG TPA: D-alanyl-D-alanine carboxypeptidase/D-alanyl-D-alanine-endopeptidase [Tepidisphaeraceae bacterium]|jgi:D-alanyl-D-alanine carboxypeptidase/D-alanyl-D-alanine-endopeptidase (penicillin-binding protein 4)